MTKINLTHQSNVDLQNKCKKQLTVKENFATLSKTISSSITQSGSHHLYWNLRYLTRKYFSRWIQISVSDWSIPLLSFINSWSSSVNVSIYLLPIWLRESSRLKKLKKRHILRTLVEKTEKQCIFCWPRLKKLNFIFFFAFYICRFNIGFKLHIIISI